MGDKGVNDVTMSIREDYVSLDCRSGYYRGKRAAFDAMTWERACERFEDVWDGFPDRDLAWQTIAELPESIAHVVLRIMAAEWEG